MVKKKLDEQAISDILDKYGVGKVRDFSLMNKGCVHTNYLLITSRGKFVLRVYEERTNDQILLEMKLLAYLSSIKIPTPRAVLSKGDKFIVSYKGLTIGLFTFLEGSHVSDSRANLEQLHSLGVNLGRFHTSCSSFKPEELFSKKNYDKKWVLQILKELKKDLPDFPTNYEEYILKTLEEIVLPETLPQGITHGDFHGDNVLFIKNKVSGVLDFDDCFYGNLLSDVGCVIGYWCINNKINSSRCRAFIKGYEEERTLLDIEKECLYEQAKLFMLIHLIYWLWNKKNWRDDIKPFKVLNNLKKISKEEFMKNIFKQKN